MNDVLRRPTPPPGMPVPFVGRDAEVEALAGVVAGGARTLVLHGPPGVGKSALAAALVERIGAEPGPVHWLSLDDHADAETTLLRLLAEHGAPRRPILEAAMLTDKSDPQREFDRRLWRECERHIRNSVIVLDGVGLYGEAMLGALTDGAGLVIVTTQFPGLWLNRPAHVHDVLPLRTGDAAVLVQDVAQVTGTDSQVLRRLASAARGLPVWLRVAGAVLARMGDTPPDEVSTPDDLFTLAWNRLDSGVQDALLRLAVRERNTTTFTARTVAGLLAPAGDPPDLPHLLSSLEAYELLRTVRDGVLALPSPVAAAALRHVTKGGPRHLRAEVTRELVNAASDHAWDTVRLLDGRASQPSRFDRGAPGARMTPDELAAHVDEFIMLVDRGRPLPLLVDALATLLAVRGDAHRLVALHRRSGGGARMALAQLLRDVGAPQQHDIRLFDGEFPRRIVLSSAEARYCIGDLAGTLNTLDRGLSEDGFAPAAWFSLVRGAVLCDQGRPLEAEVALRESAEEHRRAGCLRGRGWALFHYARVCLLLNRPQQADHLLGQALQAMRTVGDERGRNWIATERIRLHLLRRDGAAATLGAQEALAAHQRAEDIRGMGWTCQYLGLAHALQGRLAEARVAMRSATRHFKACADLLGATWTRHRLALLSEIHSARRQLLLCCEEFDGVGCSLGQAWSLVEIVLRSERSSLTRYDVPLARAEELFEGLNDQAGLAWVRTLRALHEGPPTYQRRVAPRQHLPTNIAGREQLQADLTEFWRAAVHSDTPVIPLHARDTMASPDSDGPKPLLKYLASTAGLSATPGCHVRLTLLDDSPSAHAPTRILLRVIPEEDHPWSAPADEEPWLTSVAVPLTPLSVEPPSALLRPSRHADQGAEFDITPHRSGTHVIRFTALERTGTVLQQVETELEIPDSGRPAGLAAPHATSLWER
ncbi:AAA family ATPase [Streptomyces sp. CA-251387]|uniref:AAA family ATPase n=1 Tax=Streptomyces sp. CA-251387 TaxID=3240064 RepID=UPI003D8FA6AE